MTYEEGRGGRLIIIIKMERIKQEKASQSEQIYHSSTHSFHLPKINNQQFNNTADIIQA